MLRYGAFYGPGTSMAPDGKQSELIRKRKFPIVGDGRGLWSFIHVADAAAATVAAVEHGSGGVYNVVDDDPAPVPEWLSALAQESAPRSRCAFLVSSDGCSPGRSAWWISLRLAARQTRRQVEVRSPADIAAETTVWSDARTPQRERRRHAILEAMRRVPATLRNRDRGIGKGRKKYSTMESEIRRRGVSLEVRLPAAQEPAAP